MRVHQIGGFKSSPNFMGNMFFSQKKMVELRPTENPVILHMCRELWFIFKIHHGKSLHFPFQIPSFFWANHPKHDLFYQDLSPLRKKRERDIRHTLSHTPNVETKKKTLKAACLYMCLVYKWQFFQLVPEIIKKNGWPIKRPNKQAPETKALFRIRIHIFKQQSTSFRTAPTSQWLLGWCDGSDSDDSADECFIQVFDRFFFHKTPLKTKECPREKSGKLEDAFPTEIVTFVSFRGCMNAVHRRWLIQMSQENPYVKKKNGPSCWSRRKN